MPKYELVLIDADNTLFDFNEAEKTALCNTFDFFDLPYDGATADIYSVINNGLWKEFEQNRIGKEFLKTERFARLNRILNLNVDHINMNDVYMDFLSREAPLIEGAFEVLSKLYGKVKLVIATNGISSVQKGRLANSGISDLIDHMVVSEDTGFQKPMSEYFDYIFKLCGSYNKSKTIIIGDSLTSDIKGGYAAGIKTCWYNPLKLKNDLNIPCDYIISKLSQIPAIVL